MSLEEQTGEGTDGRLPTQPACSLLHTAFLLGLFFDREDGSDMFFQLNRPTRRHILHPHCFNTDQTPHLGHG
jgi:hypothetical protein